MPFNLFAHYLLPPCPCASCTSRLPTASSQSCWPGPQQPAKSIASAVLSHPSSGFPLRKWPAILIHNTFRDKNPIAAQLSPNRTALELSTQQPSIAGHCSNVPGWQTNSCSSSNPSSHLSSPLTTRPASCSLEAFSNVRVGNKIFYLLFDSRHTHQPGSTKDFRHWILGMGVII